MKMVSATIIISGGKFILAEDFLSDYLITRKVKLDEEKGYTAQWMLKDRKLYLNAFKAYTGNKEINLNDLFPDLFSNPSPVMAYWVTESIELDIGYNAKYLCNSVVIKIDKGHVSKIFHKQFQLTGRISEKRLHELIHTISNMSLFESKVFYYTATGLNEYETVKKLIPVGLCYGGLDSITFRLLEIMRKHPVYFKSLLCFYYPFSSEMLKKYQECLNWMQLSENLFLDWDEELLMEFKDKWSWGYIGEYILGIKGKLANVDFLLKYYEMGLIDADVILDNQIMHNRFYNYDNAFSNIVWFYEEFDEIAQLVSRNEALEKDMNELAIERIKRHSEMVVEDDRILMDNSENRSNTTQKVSSLVEVIINEMNNEPEKERCNNNQNQPKELEQIISFLEREGKMLDASDWRQFYFCIPSDIDPFMFDNPLRNGIDYTFNTQEKRKLLDATVEMFLIEESIRIQIRGVKRLVENKKLIISTDNENIDREQQHRLQDFD